MPPAPWTEPETAGAGTSLDVGRRVPGWAAWGDEDAAFGAVILARRWRNHGLTPAQVFLVLDGVLPPHWDDQERLLLMDDEEAGRRLRQTCRFAMLATSCAVREEAPLASRAVRRTEAAGPLSLLGTHRAEPQADIGIADRQAGRRAGPYQGAAGSSEGSDPNARARPPLRDFLAGVPVEARSSSEEMLWVLDSSLCELCGRNRAATELGGVECWECYSEH